MRWVFLVGAIALAACATLAALNSVGLYPARIPSWFVAIAALGAAYDSFRSFINWGRT